MRRSSFNTIRARLTLWGAGITFVTCLLLCVTMYSGLSWSLLHEVDGILKGEVHELSAIVFARHDHDYAAAEEDIRLELSHRERGDVSFRLLNDQGQVVINCDPKNWFAALTSPPPHAGRTSSWSAFETVKTANRRAPVRVYAERVEGPDGRVHVAQAGYLFDQAERSLAMFRLICLLGLTVTMLFAVAGGRIIAKRSLRPIQLMTAKAQDVGASSLEGRIPRTGNGDELDKLAETLNAMLERIHRYVGRLQQFTADASHELRSPLAALRGSAEVALSNARSEAELRTVIEDSVEQYARLGRIAEDLLLLARADAGELALDRKTLPVEKVVADVIELYRPLAEDRHITLTQAGDADVWVEADGPRLRQLLANLIDNAVKHGGADVTVGISATREDLMACLTVTDNGPGITPHDLARVFDRFFRADRSRSVQGAGGAGLGLSICRTIAEAHGGSIAITSEHGHGTRVTVHIPLAPDHTNQTMRPGVNRRR
ncbi:MAG: heavy metal sensor histidine kinase [Phycisphaerae bacterium]|nr:heavy metal sensor histidine kinase [Phycisphaerae bacterium]